MRHIAQSILRVVPGGLLPGAGRFSLDQMLGLKVPRVIVALTIVAVGVGVTAAMSARHTAQKDAAGGMAETADAALSAAVQLEVEPI